MGQFAGGRAGSHAFSMHPVLLAPGDVVLTRSGGIVGRAIRLFTRRIGESRTKASHTGIIVEGGPLEAAIIIEALATVKRHRLWDRYVGRNHQVAVFRPLNLSPDEMVKVLAKAETYVGRRYGYLKVLAHWLDWVLQGAFVFRRLANQDRYPICSWVVAYAFAEAGKHFDFAPGAATPDDIWDFVTGPRPISGSRGARPAVAVTCPSPDPPDDDPTIQDRDPYGDRSGYVHLPSLRHEREHDLREVRRGARARLHHQGRWHQGRHLQVPPRARQDQVADVLCAGHDL